MIAAVVEKAEIASEQRYGGFPLLTNFPTLTVSSLNL